MNQQASQHTGCSQPRKANTQLVTGNVNIDGDGQRGNATLRISNVVRNPVQQVERHRSTQNIIPAFRRVSGVNEENKLDLHELLAYDLAVWSYQMHVSVYQDTPICEPRRIAIENDPSNENSIRSETRDQKRSTQLKAPSANTVHYFPSLSSPCSEDNDSLLLQLPKEQTIRTITGGRHPPETEAGKHSKPLELVPEKRAEKFPLRLHKLLEDLAAREGGKEIASFLPHGLAFCVYKPKEFAALMKEYFNMTLFSSFQRQLLLYRFERVKHGKDKGAFFHELFQQGNPLMSTYMRPMKTLRRPRSTATDAKPSSPCFHSNSITC